jgi:hypothetical protein
MKQMTDTYDYYRCSVLGVQDVPRADTKSYGIVDARKVPSGWSRSMPSSRSRSPRMRRRRWPSSAATS